MRLADVLMVSFRDIEVGDYVRFGSRVTGLPTKYTNRFWRVTAIDTDREWLYLVNSSGNTDLISLAPSSMNQVYRWNS